MDSHKLPDEGIDTNFSDKTLSGLYKRVSVNYDTQGFVTTN